MNDEVVCPSHITSYVVDHSPRGRQSAQSEKVLHNSIVTVAPGRRNRRPFSDLLA